MKKEDRDEVVDLIMSAVAHQQTLNQALIGTLVRTGALDKGSYRESLQALINQAHDLVPPFTRVLNQSTLDALLQQQKSPEELRKSISLAVDNTNPVPKY